MTTCINPIVCSDRADWLDARRGSIGASEAAAVCGVNPYMGPLELYARKTGAVQGSETTEAMEWGTRLESVIADAYAENTGRVVHDPGPYTIQMRADLPYMTCTLDRLIEPVSGHDGEGDLQIKTCNAFSRAAWDDGPPIHYQVQVQHELAVTGLQWGSFAVLVGGQHFIWCDVERDDDFIAWLTGRVAEFWKSVQDRKPPTADQTVSNETLRRLYPETPGTVIELPEEAVELDRLIGTLKAERKTRDGQIKDAEQRLKQLIGTASIGILPDGSGRYAYKEQARSEYVVKASTSRILRRLKA